MIDFNAAGTQRPEQMNAPDQVEGDPAAAFLSKMAEFNLAPETLVRNGVLQRFDVDKKGAKAGWYVYHDGDILQPVRLVNMQRIATRAFSELFVDGRLGPKTLTALFLYLDTQPGD